MKKLFALALALALTLALATTCFAAINYEPGIVDELPYEDETEVKVTYNASGDAATCYALEIEWESFEFTYNQGGKTWNPETHTDDVTGSAWNKTTAKVTVTNHSNVAVYSTITYEAGTTSGNASASLGETGAETQLAAATPAEQASHEATLTVTGVPATDADGAVIGTVTVTIAAAAAQ